MLLPAVLLPWLVLGTHAVPLDVPIALGAAVGLGAALYGAPFVMLGLVVARRALVLGLLYIVLFELVLAPRVAGVRSLSIRECVFSVAGRIASDLPGAITGTVTLSTVWTMSGVILVGALAFAIRRLQRFEVTERL